MIFTFIIIFNMYEQLFHQTYMQSPN